MVFSLVNSANEINISYGLLLNDLRTIYLNVFLNALKSDVDHKNGRSF